VVSHHYRLGAVGISLAVAGVFIAAPAQAASAPHTPAHGLTAARSTAAATNGTAATGYKTFSSSAKTAGHTAVGSRPVLPEAAEPAATSSSVIYVEADPNHCTKEVGQGSYDDPYCLLQSAVNAATSGDTIQVWEVSDDNLAYNENVSIKGKSDLTIVGHGTGVGDAPPAGNIALSITGSSGITVDNMVLESADADTVYIDSSSDITFNGDSLLSEGGSGNDLSIFPGSSGITVTRSTLGNDGPAYDVYDTGTNVVLASDVMYAELGANVDAAGSGSLDVTADTLNRGCAGAVGIYGFPQNAVYSIQDNVFEAGPTTPAYCSGNGAAYAPAVTVDVASNAVSSTTTDYNDFNFSTATGSNTEAYDWYGTTYATLAAFQAAVSQGAHDAVDPTGDAQMFLAPGALSAPMTADAVPVATSLSIGTANTAAPGYQSTDFYGRGSYDDRGALEYVAPSLSAALTVYQTGGRAVQADAAASVQTDASALYTYSWGDGSSTTGPSTAAVSSHTYAHPGDYTVSVTVTDVFNDSSKASVLVQTAGSDLTPVTPTRVLDTRHGTGTGGVIAPVGSDQALTLKVAGVGAIPADATAVVLNITATDATATGHINAYAAGTTLPTPSNVNFVKGVNVADLAIVQIGTDGEIELYNGSPGTVDLVADTSGYFAPTQADGYASLTPHRLLDTRTATGGHEAPLTGSDPVRLKVAGVGGVPTDATSAELNLTVASPTVAGYVRAYPDGTTMPSVSSVNFNAGTTIANAAIVPIGADGYIDIVLPTPGSVRMVVDVDGYYTTNTAQADSSYEPITPIRWLDTRTIKNGALPAGYYYYLPFGTDFWGDVDPTVSGVLTNATVTQPAAVSGDLVVFPETFLGNGNLNVPTSSTLNFTKNATVPNMEITAPGDYGDVDYLNQSAGSIQLIVDLFGYFQNN
jgi:PKD domain